jgi:hypothetical protein
LVIEKSMSCRVYEKQIDANDLKGNFIQIIKILGMVSFERYLFTCIVSEVKVIAKLADQ